MRRDPPTGLRHVLPRELTPRPSQVLRGRGAPPSSQLLKTPRWAHAHQKEAVRQATKCTTSTTSEEQEEPSSPPALVYLTKTAVLLRTCALCYKGIDDEAAETIAKELVEIGLGLPGCPSLRTLDLRGNQIGDRGAKALASALEHNSLLESLMLDGNHIGDEGAMSLAMALDTNKTLCTLGLAANAIGDAGCTALFEALDRPHPKLTRLLLASNKIFEPELVARIVLTSPSRGGAGGGVGAWAGLAEAAPGPAMAPHHHHHEQVGLNRFPPQEDVPLRPRMADLPTPDRPRMARVVEEDAMMVGSPWAAPAPSPSRQSTSFEERRRRHLWERGVPSM